MSRGWESKDVEGQVEEALAKRERPIKPGKTDEQIAAEHELGSLEMNRTRILNELEASRNPRYREMLAANLKDIEAKLSEFRRTSSP